ncbi:Repeat domain-containing protein [Streptomyces sp. Ncost-T6T-1]|uniref:FG-GAP and VCBS repeat-containing protein n=1 Tax=Streptomyces sp. Ncost-T6T-1 TaxID=1100828 RepID=UPI000805BC0E|nr:FG-GAP and VCBS repeat-containing protein [Streptomyces sp. Ncost-T6T-1]SBU97936.1 Repeat domain-containing protein [Streptomyces sp. Ncost-T6T-1]
MQTSRLRTASAVFVTLAATATAAPAFSGTAVAAAPSSVVRQPVDFNGDGYEDMIASVPDGTVSGIKKAGYVVVHPGDAKGLNPARHQVINQNTPGVPGSAAANARFGGSAPADIDADGYTDLLVSAGTGRPIILFGGKSGLGTRAVEFQGQGQGQGQGEAVGDFDGDGRADVAGIDNADWAGKIVLSENIGADGSVGSTRTALTADGVTTYEGVQAADINNDGKGDLLVRTGCNDEPDCGGTSLYLSTGTGFTRTDIVTAPGTYLNHASVTVGSVNGDAYPDLVFTRQPTGLDSDVDFPSKGGAVAVALGGPKGQNTSVKPKWITQATAGVPGADERGDAMGGSAAVGDLDGDGYGEVVVGLPGEDVGTAKDAGGVLIFKGRATGITGADTKVIGQSTADVPGVDEQGDGFGGEVHVVAGAKNVPPTLAVAAPGENTNQGGVWLFKGSRTGPVTKGSISFGEASLGVTPSAVRFGNWLG